MFAKRGVGLVPALLVLVAVGLGWYLAFVAPNDVERALVKEGETYIFLVKSTPTDIEVLPILREIPAGLSMEEAAKATIQNLLAGPTQFDIANGFSTAINEGVVVNSVSIEGGMITVDFNERIDEGVAGSARVLAIRDQLEKTLLRIPRVTSYKLTVNGEREVILEP